MARALAPLIGMSEKQAINELKRCVVSLQYEEAVGPEARHSHRGKPDNAMDLHEGTKFVHRLLEAWLLDKAKYLYSSSSGSKSP